jgi:hypothetical protein
LGPWGEVEVAARRMGWRRERDCIKGKYFINTKEAEDPSTTTFMIFSYLDVCPAMKPEK